jgi:hypothetical protein
MIAEESNAEIIQGLRFALANAKDALALRDEEYDMLAAEYKDYQERTTRIVNDYLSECSRIIGKEN